MSHANIIELCCVGLAVFLASNIWFYVRVLRPIQKLSYQATRLSQGELNSFDRHCGGIPEIAQLRRAMASMVGHVLRAQEQSQVYAAQLADGQETERKRIARELHDDAIQSTIAVTQSVDMAKNWIKTNPDRALQMLQLAREQAVEIVTNLRNLIGGLRPPALEELGLIPALEMQIQSLNESRVTLQVTGVPRRLEETHELALFRATQEALRNSIRHSRATAIHVDIDYQPTGITMHIKDDGQGFCPPHHLGDLAFEKHYGLLGIQERVTCLGGQFRLDSEVGSGTTLTIHLPTDIQNQPEDFVRDPVCSALIEPQRAYGSVTYKRKTYYFCCPVCQGAFQKDPDLYHNVILQTSVPLAP